MRSELGSEVTGTMRETTDQEAGAAEVGGVRWLGGVPGPERSLRAPPPVERAGTTFVIGRAHGPRLLELLCAAG